ncbi:MAG TPA: hypothetical protein VMG34_03225 [Bacteroidota bacterium]|nr:hypothetical protein [Bacteroidota bacterium]
MRLSPSLIIFALSFSLSAAACRLNFSNADFSAVYGTWQLVKTQGGWTGTIHTPEVEGYTAKIVFREEGVAEFYRNDSLKDQIPFTLSAVKILSGRKVAFIIHWSNKSYPDSQYILFSGNDTLHITGRDSEFSHFYYVRAHP